MTEEEIRNHFQSELNDPDHEWFDEAMIDKMMASYALLAPYAEATNCYVGYKAATIKWSTNEFCVDLDYDADEPEHAPRICYIYAPHCKPYIFKQYPWAEGSDVPKEVIAALKEIAAKGDTDERS